MKNPKLTPWFPGDVTPAREGWYQRDYSAIGYTEVPDYWDGEVWLIGNESDGIKPNQRCIALSEKSWRGLAADPKAKP